MIYFLLIALIGMIICGYCDYLLREDKLSHIIHFALTFGIYFLLIGGFVGYELAYDIEYPTYEKPARMEKVWIDKNSEEVAFKQ